MLDTSSIDCHTLVELVYNNDLSTMRHYFSMGLDPCVKSDVEEPLFHLAIEEENLEMIKLFLDYKVDIDLTNYQGNNAIVVSAAIGNIDIFHLLLKHHANLNDSYNLDGSNPLIIAVWNNHEKLSQEIIKHIININETNKYEISALGYAAYINSFPLVNLLLHYQADINAVGPSGRTVLNLLCEESNQLEMIKYLLIKGANPNQIRWDKVNSYILEELKIFIDDLNLKISLENHLMDENEDEDGSSSSGSTGQEQQNKRIIKI